MKRKLSLFLTLFAFSWLFAQHSATITVNDATTSQPVVGAQVVLNATSLTTDNSGQVVFTNLADNTYSYSISKTCYVDGSGSVVVNGADVSQTVTIALQTTNDLFISVSNGGFINPLQAGFAIHVTGPNGFDQMFTSDNQLATYVGNVPYGDYNYAISKDCFVTKTGTVTVGCNAGAEVSVIVIREAKTTNDLYLSIPNDFGSQQPGFTINLSNGGTYNQDIVSGGSTAAFFEAVPYGNFTYTITKNCFETITKQITIGCNAGQPFDITEFPVEKSTNDLYISIPATIGQQPGFSITLTNGVDYELTLVSNSESATLFEDVPFGNNYTYTISKDCSQTITGNVIINCNGGQPIEITKSPVNETTNDLSVVVSKGDFLGTRLGGFTINITNGSTYNEIAVSDSEVATFFKNVPYGDYTYTILKDCYETESGSVTVGCNGGIESQLYVVPVAKTTNDLFFLVGNFGTADCKVTITNTDTYEQTTLTAQNFDNEYLFTDVPYGSYTYEITKDCYNAITGSVEVECLPNGDVVGVFTDDLTDQTTNDVYVTIGDLFINPEGFSVNLTGESYDETIESGSPLFDVFTAVPFGNYTYTITQDCYQTVTGSITVSCNEGDGNSIVVAEPDAIVIDDTVTQADNVLTANATGVTYQWVDCDNENAPIEGATAQTFTATANGSYAVIITNEDCSTPVTSTCLTVDNLAVRKNVANLFSVYPNPAQNNLMIDLKESAQNVSVEIINMLGQKVFTGKYSEGNNINLNISQLNSGVYIINMNTDNKVSAKRFIKE